MTTNPYVEVIEWLESPDGEEWSLLAHGDSRKVLLVALKSDNGDPGPPLWLA